MKKVVTLLFITCLMLSCENKKEQNGTPAIVFPADAPTEGAATSASESNDQGAATNKPSESTSSCDQFLVDYENFFNEYLAIVKKFSADPTNTSFLNEMTSYSQKVKDWADRGKNIMNDCVSDPAFNEKYMNITNRITKAATEMYNH
jgi:hypothetical protein